MQLHWWVLLWYMVGILSFIYWWTTEFKLKLEWRLIIIMLFVGFSGPLNFVYGYLIHGRNLNKY